MSKVKMLIIAHNKNVASPYPSSQATMSPLSHTPPTGSELVINCQVKVYEAEELSENPSDELETKDHYYDHLLANVHHSLNQTEFLILQTLSNFFVKKSTMHKDSKYITKIHRHIPFHGPTRQPLNSCTE